MMLSFSTWGSSRGAKALEDESVAEALAYSSIAAKSPGRRERHLLKWFEQAKFRYAPMKARYARENFDQIESMGGIEIVSRMALQRPGRAAKLRFVTGFKGIGDKYGRNLWMDVCDKDFMRSIAVDRRILNIAAALDVRWKTYDDLERFFIGVADALEITPWGLDRFLYKNCDGMLDRLRASASPNTSKVWVLVARGTAVAAFTNRAEATAAQAKRDGATIVRVPLDPG
ncbi:MAG: hypothetical protein KDK70_11180 [Myxococcales bacterium]|nr:hypothetical protein [Myxococcales bacterium]